ncbi:hypothetical protein Bhyg_04546, partial [Pseudolycoriella hygida]
MSSSSPTLFNVGMTLRTEGRNARVILNPKRENPIHFSEDKLDNFVTNTGMSLIQMNTVTNFIRATAGKRSISSYYRDHASKKAKIFEDVYQCADDYFDIEKLPEKEKRSVVFAEAETLLDSVLQSREQHGEIVVK